MLYEVRPFFLSCDVCGYNDIRYGQSLDEVAKASSLLRADRKGKHRYLVVCSKCRHDKGRYDITKKLSLAGWSLTEEEITKAIDPFAGGIF